MEHPVTEAVTGIDLVKAQIRIAAGERLSLTQDEVEISGHAIECRINAKMAGKVTNLLAPGGMGIRVDSAMYNGCQVPPWYDAMLLKLVVHGEDREEAIRKIQCALGELVIEGVETNLDDQYEIFTHPVYQSGPVDTGFMEKYFNFGRK